MTDSTPPTLERGFRMRTPVVFALLLLSGCEPSKEDQAIDAYNRGLQRCMSGDYEGAIHDLDEAVRRTATLAEAFSERGLAFGEMGRFDQAIADLTRAIHLDPDYVPAWYNRGNTFADRHEYFKAIADFTEATRASR